jgi:hypothetical protein
MIKKFHLIALGHQDKNKNVINFLKIFNKKFQNNFIFTIVGKIDKQTHIKLKLQIKKNKNIKIINRYLNNNEYKKLINKAHFIVIPDGHIYKYMHSGVIWDCFAIKKPFLAPDNAINRDYINSYKVGLIYNKNFKTIALNKFLKSNYKKYYKTLKKDYSFKENLKKTKNILDENLK